jgi:hypothetical protein
VSWAAHFRSAHAHAADRSPLLAIDVELFATVGSQRHSGAMRNFAWLLHVDQGGCRICVGEADQRGY